MTVRQRISDFKDIIVSKSKSVGFWHDRVVNSIIAAEVGCLTTLTGIIGGGPVWSPEPVPVIIGIGLAIIATATGLGLYANEQCGYGRSQNS